MPEQRSQWPPNSVSTTEYTSFDILGRVTRSKQTTDGVEYGTDANPMTYTYNLSGALIEQKYPSGRVVRNTLDANGDLAEVDSKKTLTDFYRPYVNSFVYNAAGAVSSLKLGNGRFENTQFNSRLQPTQIGLGASASTQNLLKLNFDYGTTDNNGNVKSQTITVPTVGSNAGFVATQNYSYDSLNRIKQATETIPSQTGWQQSFQYDRYGNRRFDNLTGATTTLAANCTTAVCNPTIDTATNRLVGYVFDNSGNTTTDAENRTFVYDAENKQTEVRDAQNNIVGQYRYDGDGRRIKKIVPDTGETTIFVYDAGSKLVAEYSTVVASGNDAKISYLTNDHLGSPRITTDAIGQVISRRDFMPFGEEIPRATYGNDSVRQKFTGYERDTEIDLDFAQARYFDAGFGRFSSADNFLNDTNNRDPASWNLFAYVRNNPLRFIDPSGDALQILKVKVKVDGKEVNVDSIRGKNRTTMLGWLNHTYGCEGCVGINEDGVITLDTSKVSKEVLAVTTDLTQAINDPNSVIGLLGLEGVPGVRFAEGRNNVSTSQGKRNVIAIDFKDFEQLTGDQEAISSFSNYSLVHEVLHFYHFHQEDTLTGNDRTGLVENRVNEIRQVRGDLLRAEYNAPTQDDTSTMFFGRALPDKKTKDGLKRNHNGGIIAESRKVVRWSKSMVSAKE